MADNDVLAIVFDQHAGGNVARERAALLRRHVLRTDRQRAASQQLLGLVQVRTRDAHGAGSARTIEAGNDA